MYEIVQPTSVTDFAPRWREIAGAYADVVGFSRFGDLMLSNPSLPRMAYLFTEHPELVELAIADVQELENQFLVADKIRRLVLREKEFRALAGRLGHPAGEEVFFPQPFRVLGGSGELETFAKGNVRVHLDIYAQCVL